MRPWGFVMLGLLGLATGLLAQPVAPKTCKETPVQCDKELLLLHDEVDQKRHLLAGAWAIAEEWQQRAEQAEAKLQALAQVPAPTKEPQ